MVVRLSAPPNALVFIARHIEWRLGNAAAAFLQPHGNVAIAAAITTRAFVDCCDVAK